MDDEAIDSCPFGLVLDGNLGIPGSQPGQPHSEPGLVLGLNTNRW
jgi:hypothetical protein